MIKYAAIALIGISFSSFADDQTTEIDCSVKNLPETLHFKALQQKALKLNEDVCLALLNSEDNGFAERQKAAYTSYGNEVKNTAINTFSRFDFHDLEKPFSDFLTQISDKAFNQKQLPSFAVDLSNDGSEYLFNFSNPAKTGKFATNKNSDCNSLYATTCSNALKDFANAINPYKYSYQTLTAIDTERKLAILSNQWDQFSGTGRSQTLLDIVATSVLEHRHFKKGYIVGPPTRQWTLLHPSLVYEHLNAAPDGDKDEAGVAIEWFGVNWWSDDSPLFGIPFGVSVASVYSDRPNIDDVGHGLMFHFDNKYSVGWSNRSGENGIYVTIDLLKLVDDKKQQLNRYKTRLASY